MASYKCPFCGNSFVLTPQSFSRYNPCFSCMDSTSAMSGVPRDTIAVSFYRCPECEEVSIRVDGRGSDVKGIDVPIRPKSNAVQFPEYVPISIRSDYEEACSILTLSPKASATLARRCLQSMIRDFWKIEGSSLYDEISKLEDCVPATQKKVINALRKIGNIGAHPEADVNLIIDIKPGDAEKLLKVIELLIKQWYIERHEQEVLYKDVLALDESKQAEKHQSE